MTNGEALTQAAERLGIPLRTLDNVKDTLARAKLKNADKYVASFMLKHGRLTAEARAYVEAYR